MTAPRSRAPRTSRLRPGAASAADPPSPRPPLPALPADFEALRDAYLAQEPPARLVARVRGIVRGPARRRRRRLAAICTALLCAFATGWVGGALGSWAGPPAIAAAARGPGLPAPVGGVGPAPDPGVGPATEWPPHDLLARLLASAGALPRPDRRTLEAWEELQRHPDPRVRDLAAVLRSLAESPDAAGEGSASR